MLVMTSIALPRPVPQDPPSPTALSVLVVGASGGVGASCVAAALALEAARRTGSSALVDLHLDGGGIDVTVGVEHVPGPRWPDLLRVRGEVDGESLVRILPRQGSCGVLAADGRRWWASPDTRVRTTVVHAVLESLRHSGVGVVVDCPAARVPPVVQPGDLVVVVASTTVRGLADLDALCGRLVDGDNPPLGSGRLRLLTRGAPAPPGLLDAVAEQVGAPVLVHVGDDRRVVRDLARGEWPGRSGALRRAAEVLQDAADEDLVARHRHALA